MPEANPTARAGKPLQSLLLAIGLGLFWFVAGIQILPIARINDFLNLYTGASFALHWDWHHIYTGAGQLALERQLAPERHELWPFVRPPAYAILMSPLALIPFGAAFAVWICAQWAVFLGCWAWAWKKFGPEALIWAALYFACPLGIAHGQDCALYLAILCGAFALGEKNRQFLAGLLLGLGLVKFHLFLVWPLLLLIQRRWRFLAGFTLCGTVQAVVSIAVLGWSGMKAYADFILHLNSYYAPERNINLNTIFLDLRIPSAPWVLLASAAIVALILWCSWKPQPLWVTFALAIGGSLLIGPHAYGYDGAMLLLPFWCVIFRSQFRIAKLTAATICTPITVAASFSGPPFACWMALLLLIFVVAVCLESRSIRIHSGRVHSAPDPDRAPLISQPAI
jgi:hypothetical protein